MYFSSDCEWTRFSLSIFELSILCLSINHSRWLSRHISWQCNVARSSSFNVLDENLYELVWVLLYFFQFFRTGNSICNDEVRIEFVNWKWALLRFVVETARGASLNEELSLLISLEILYLWLIITARTMSKRPRTYAVDSCWCFFVSLTAVVIILKRMNKLRIRV